MPSEIHRRTAEAQSLIGVFRYAIVSAIIKPGRVILERRNAPRVLRNSSFPWHGNPYNGENAIDLIFPHGVGARSSRKRFDINMKYDGGIQKRYRWLATAVVSVLIWSLGAAAQGDRQTSTAIVSRGITIIGDEGRQISDQDITALEQALPDGAKPWLLNGDEGTSGVKSIQAYLPPTTIVPSLRKGTMTILCCRSKPKWSIVCTFGCAPMSYAQVAIEGRTFDDIRGVDDPNRPFSVRGNITDAELIGLVNAVRANPAASGTDQNKTLPILEVFRRSDKDSVNVYLREGPAPAQGFMPERVVVLRQEGPAWVVVSSGKLIPTKVD